jgi:hypothetical protein
VRRSTPTAMASHSFKMASAVHYPFYFSYLLFSSLLLFLFYVINFCLHTMS